MLRIGSVIIVILIMVVCTAPVVRSQVLVNKSAVSATFGANLPIGDMADDLGSGGLNADNGIEGGLSIQRGMSRSFALAVDVRYVTFGVDAGLFFLDATAHSILFGASGIYCFGNVASSTQPFVIAGIMIGKPTITADKKYRDSEMKVDLVYEFHAGCGVLQMASKSVGLSAALELNHMATDGAKVVTERDGSEVFSSEVPFNLQWLEFRLGVVKFF